MFAVVQEYVQIVMELGDVLNVVGKEDAMFALEVGFVRDVEEVERSQIQEYLVFLLKNVRNAMVPVFAFIVLEQGNVMYVKGLVSAKAVLEVEYA